MTLNGGSRSLHRRGDWLVSIAGQHKFRKPYESAPSYVASAFNHYCRNGSVYVVAAGSPPSPWSSGFSLEGWDHRLIPGATSYLGETEKALIGRAGDTCGAFAAAPTSTATASGGWSLSAAARTSPTTSSSTSPPSASATTSP